jgi:hypothetical protein
MAVVPGVLLDHVHEYLAQHVALLAHYLEVGRLVARRVGGRGSMLDRRLGRPPPGFGASP